MKARMSILLIYFLHCCTVL